ncbi:hypothetical protein [Oceanobacter sp. 4_MG-2023]|uniref:hypothetical protein n=1 Tax=Oceanobacter sp. 4_MG-2023 TaxID=3062623 RepID=UPI0027369FE1|nr:hypothetical protein [Oceanobacter sp. 4_MG-2023]MDP2548897.1 hypothetical protein [Oceanobacter sp. 4_MG-2023]
MSIDVRQIALAVRGTIEQALTRYNLPDTEAAVRLLIMIAAHESGAFMYVRQKGGPALGMFQMEPPTYQYCCDYLKRSGRFKALPRQYSAARLVTDSVLAAGFARVYLYSHPEPLPDADDLQGLANYAKKYWNSELGAATPDDYLNAYNAVYGNPEPEQTA